VFFTPVFVDDLVAVIYDLLGKPATGVFNVVGGERISKYNFALKVADVFELQRNCIVKSHLSDVEMLAKRPVDMSLSNKKTTQLLGESIGDVHSGIKGLLATSGRSIQLSASLLNE